MFAIVDVPLLASTHSNIGFTAFNDANRRQTTLLGSHVRRKTGFADARLRGASARRRNLSGIRRAPRRSVRAGGRPAADDTVATDLPAVDTRCTSLARGHAQLKPRSENAYFERG